MPFCPVCRDEFQDWVKICPDDNVPLVAELPPLQKQGKKTETPLEDIAIAPNEPVARMWAELLENNGIHCMISTGSSGAASQWQPFNIQMTLYVAASEAKRARNILEPLLNP